MADAPGKSHVLSHEEIVRNFIASKAIDFTALGNFIAQNGESIAISGRGDYGARVGWYNTFACFWRVDPNRISPVEVAGKGIASEVLGP